MGFLDSSGLSQYDALLKGWVGAQIEESGEDMTARIAALERIVSTFRVFDYGTYTPVTEDELTQELRLARLERVVASLRVFS